MISVIAVFFLVALSLNFGSAHFYNNCEGENCCLHYFDNSQRVIMNYAPISGGYFQPYNITMGDDLITVNIYQTGVASPRGWADVVNFYCNQTLVGYFYNDTNGNEGGNETNQTFESVSNIGAIVGINYIDWNWDVPENSTGFLVSFNNTNYSVAENNFKAENLSPNTTYTIWVYVNYDGNLSEGKSDNRTTLNESQGDTTPPASVSGLGVASKGKTWIKWLWTNPSDSDFAYNIIYINGVNVANISENNYNATGLIPNTEYTIIINTKDFSGNINYTNISNSQYTLADEDDDDNGSSKKEKSNGKRSYGNEDLESYYFDLIDGGKYYIYGNDTIVLAPVDEDVSGFNWSLGWIIGLIILLIILIGVLIIFILREF